MALRQATGYDAVLPAGQTSEYAVRAVDAVGHLSRPTSVRFKAGLGLVDAEGRLLRDTVSPGRIAGVRLIRRQGSLVVRWNGIADAGGLRGYEVLIGRTAYRTVTKPGVTVPSSRVGTRSVTVRAVDRAGNRGGGGRPGALRFGSMAPEAAYATIAMRLLREPDTVEGKAFDAPALKAGGKIFAMLVGDRHVVKLPAERCAELVEAGSEPFESGGRRMREWVSVGSEQASAWPELAREALACARRRGA